MILVDGEVANVTLELTFPPSVLDFFVAITDSVIDEEVARGIDWTWD